MELSDAKTRNPGPRWGYGFLRAAEAFLPRPMFRLGLYAGAVVGWACMPTARMHQRAYWQSLFGRPPTLREQWKHFCAFAENLMGKLALDRGEKPVFRFAENSAGEEFIELCRSPTPALFGTFHIGEADLMGSMLTQFGRCIHLVRLRVDNSLDLQIIERSFGGSVRFIFVNEPGDMLFAIKKALEDGHSLALQCDRVQFGAKREAFDFLGARRWFPFTIYHLSALFGVPVSFSVALERSPDGTIPAYVPPVFHPSESRSETLQRGRVHFQSVLHEVERLLRASPTLWFNFEPLNPVAE